MICDKYYWIYSGVNYSTYVKQILMHIELISVADGHQTQFLDMCENVKIEKNICFSTNLMGQNNPCIFAFI